MNHSSIGLLLVGFDAKDADRVKRLTSMYMADPYIYRSAQDPDEALEQLAAPPGEASPVQAVVLRDGGSAQPASDSVDRICRRHPFVAVLVLAESADEARSEACLSAGAAHYLVKRQLSARVISGALRDALEQADARRAWRARREREALEELQRKEQQRLAAEVQEEARRARRARLVTFDFELCWSSDDEWHPATPCELSTRSVRIEDGDTRPAEGSQVRVSLALRPGLAPVQVTGTATAWTDTGGFLVLFRNLNEVNKALIRETALRLRRGTRG